MDITAAKNRNNVSGQLDMFSEATGTPSGATQLEGFRYPELPDYSLKDKLMLEKECSGMYFSGHLLDGYSRCLEGVELADLASLSAIGREEEGEESSRHSGGKQTVRTAGVITAVTRKTTRKNQPMAFFNLEDRYGELECLVFPRQMEQYDSLLYVDGALYVEGELSVSDDEPPKILVSSLVPLVDNEHYDGRPLPIRKGREPVRPATAQTASAANAPRPSVPTPAPEPRPAAPAAKAAPQPALPAHPTKLFLRVPDRESVLFRKAENLIAIFEGTLPVQFYDGAAASYFPAAGRLALTPYVYRELCALLGEENVVVR
jgi:DNA polymerase-3 subunit alpha